MNKYIELTKVNDGFMPANEAAQTIVDNLRNGEIVFLKEVNKRNVKFHRCYFSLLNYVYSYLPEEFRDAVPQDKFYLWLKHLQGKYKVIYEFKDGTRFVEYESIAFSKMGEAKFREYIKEQMPFLYEEVIGKFYEGKIYSDIISTIESDYQSFFGMLE